MFPSRPVTSCDAIKEHLKFFFTTQQINNVKYNATKTICPEFSGTPPPNFKF